MPPPVYVTTIDFYGILYKSLALLESVVLNPTCLDKIDFMPKISKALGLPCEGLFVKIFFLDLSVCTTSK